MNYAVLMLRPRTDWPWAIILTALRLGSIVFENQFIEFSSSLPDNYNLYGLGETIHGFKLGNNFTKTMWAADVGDPID